MPLKEYKKKRHFGVTPEPEGTDEPASKPQGTKKNAAEQPALAYVIQKHRATQLHYDFRLEWDGVLLSWAVPKGPSLDPSVKRLAMQVEDHPIHYASFEGVIPEGEYGGGTVMVWDQGTWEPEVPDVPAAIAKGDLKFTLRGKKLQGSWVLVCTRGYGKDSSRSWLLIKHRDEFASTEDIAEKMPQSIVSNRLLAQIAAANGGDVEKAATGDPIAPVKPQKRASGKAKTAPARTTQRRKQSR
jgi:bifunctional non-homologous end joining protein LigD